MKFILRITYQETLLIMDKEKNWMLITYYCPTHGNSGMIKPIEITKKEITKTFQKKDGNFKE